MILVHHLRVGRSLFTVWLLEELGLEYELEIYDRNALGRAPETLRQAHPLGKSPVIEIDGLTLAESGAIATCLVDRFDTHHRLAPPREDFAARARWTQWLHYSEGSAFAPLLIKMLLARDTGANAPLIDGFAAGEVALQLGYMQDSLGDKPFILGEEMQAPDIGFTYICGMADRLGELEPYPGLKAYLARNTQRPAFLRAFERTGG